MNYFIVKTQNTSFPYLLEIAVDESVLPLLRFNSPLLVGQPAGPRIRFAIPLLPRDEVSGVFSESNPEYILEGKVYVLAIELGRVTWKNIPENEVQTHPDPSGRIRLLIWLKALMDNHSITEVTAGSLSNIIAELPDESVSKISSLSEFINFLDNNGYYSKDKIDPMGSLCFNTNQGDETRFWYLCFLRDLQPETYDKAMEQCRKSLSRNYKGLVIYAWLAIGGLASVLLFMIWDFFIR